MKTLKQIIQGIGTGLALTIAVAGCTGQKSIGVEKVYDASGKCNNHVEMSADELIKEYGAGKRIFECVDISKQNFENANLPRIVFYDSNLKRTNFAGANLAYSNFGNSNLAYSNFVQAEVEGANFRNANLTDINFSGTDYKSAITPPEGWRVTASNERGFR